MESNLISLPLSVVICTYNRAGLLRKAIESVLEQDASSDKYELIIVDNCSTDETQGVVRLFSHDHKNVRYVFEDMMGLSYARNRGWNESGGDFILYIDDECILPAGYLKEAIRIIKLLNPDIFGGAIKAIIDFEKPIWIKNEYYSDFLDRKSGLLSRSDYLFGGNIGIRKEILYKLAGFDINLGMKGNELAFDEEIEFQKRAIDNIPNLERYFDKKLWLYHRIRKEKINLIWLFRYHYSKGFNGIEVFSIIKETESRSISTSLLRVLYLLVKVVYRLSRLIIRIPIMFFLRSGEYPYWQQYLVERIYGVEIKNLGIIFKELSYRFHLISMKGSLKQVQHNSKSSF